VTEPAPSATIAPQVRDEGDEFTTQHHVYEPHRVGLPQMRPYLRELWRRRHFAFELARTEMRAAQSTTFFGQMWLILNPLLLALVYLLLVDVLSRPQGLWYFAHLLAGLFAYYFMSGCLMTGATSVVAAGGLITNTAFPRLLLPLSAVWVSFRRFLPTLLILVAFHFAGRIPTSPHLLWDLVVLVQLICFSAGLAFFAAALQVYFRDLTQFLPYFTRIWLYVSPVILLVSQIRAKHTLDRLEWINPMMPILGNWGIVTSGVPVCRSGPPPCRVVDRVISVGPDWHFLIAGTAWAAVVLVAGALFFMSRERDFAVRL
jgi:teichoic acid transport system permease protein